MLSVRVRADLAERRGPVQPVEELREGRMAASRTPRYSIHGFHVDAGGLRIIAHSSASCFLTAESERYE